MSYLSRNTENMPRNTRLLALLALLVAFTGCITIEENYTFKKDGSGTMEYVVDMSEIGDMLKAMEGLDKSGNKDAGDMGTMDLKDEVAALKQIPGIKKVKVNDKEKFVQKLKFRFANIDALNAALNVLMNDSATTDHAFFAWEGNTLVRTNNDHARRIGADMGKDDGSGDSTDMTQFLESMKYKMSYSFASPIAHTGAAVGMVKESPNSKTVKLDTDFNAIANDNAALDLRIELSKP